MKTIKTIELKGKVTFDSKGLRAAKLKLEPQEGMMNNVSLWIDSRLFPDDFKPIANPVDGDGQLMEHDIVDGRFAIQIRVKRGEK